MRLAPFFFLELGPLPIFLFRGGGRNYDSRGTMGCTIDHVKKLSWFLKIFRSCVNHRMRWPRQLAVLLAALLVVACAGLGGANEVPQPPPCPACGLAQMPARNRFGQRLKISLGLCTARRRAW